MEFLKSVGEWLANLGWWQWVILAAVLIVGMWFAAYTGIFDWVPGIFGG